MLSLILLGLAIGGLTLTIFHPILLPDYFMVNLTTFIEASYYLNGFIPMTAIWRVVFMIVFVLFLKLMFKIFIGLIAMGSGGGKPEID